jgi:hypothetical protein
MKHFFVWALLCLCTLGVVAQANEYHAFMEQTANLEAYRNAMYLLLRISGLAWITVEWIAAIVLWRAYFLLRRAARAKGLLPHA